MSSYGYHKLDSFGKTIQVTADGRPKQKTGGITIYWAGISGAAAAYEVRPEGENTGYPADDYVQKDEKFLRYGTVVCRVSGGAADGYFLPYGTTPPSGGTLLVTKGNMYVLNESVHEGDSGSDNLGAAIEGGKIFLERVIIADINNKVVTVTISATGGTFTITIVGQTTGAIAYNANAATVLAALEALSNIAPGDVTVGLSGSVYTITFSDAWLRANGFPTVSTNAASLTGGSGTATVAVPTGTAAGPTLAQFEAALPNFFYVRD